MFRDVYLFMVKDSNAYATNVNTIIITNIA